MKAAATTHVPKMKKGHSLDLMSGEPGVEIPRLQIDPLLLKPDSESKRYWKRQQRNEQAYTRPGQTDHR